MRDYGRVHTSFWTDFEGQRWPVVVSARRLKFNYPAHAALRRHVFRRDCFTCVRCGATALCVPVGYDGRQTLYTDSILRSGYHDVLIVDHKLTIRAGGRSVIQNLQTLCETCNKNKQPEDAAAVRACLAAMATV